MGFTTLADLDTDNCTAIGGIDKKTGKPNPKSIEGYFIGTKQTVSTKAKTGFAALHVVQTKTGNTGVWGKTNLDSKLLGVPAGTMVRITFLGMQETKNNPMYKYKVEVDRENTIEVTPPGDESEKADGDVHTGAYEDDDYAEETGVDEEAPVADEIAPARALPPKRAAMTPSADQIAKTRELLNKNRSKLVS